MGFVIIILTAIFAIIFITIGIQNGGTVVDVSVLTWHFTQVPLTLVMIECLALGVFITIIVAGINEIRLRHNLWNCEKEKKKLAEELKALRNLPLTEEPGISKSEEISKEGE